MQIIKEAQLRECIKTKASYEPEGHALGRIEPLGSFVKIDLTLEEAEDLIWTLHHHSTSVLEVPEIQNFPEKRPHIAIQHTLTRIKSAQLCQRMKLYKCTIWNLTPFSIYWIAQVAQATIIV